MRAFKGLATDLEVELNPELLYTIIIKGKFSRQDVSGFSLQALAPGDFTESTDVVMMVPHREDETSSASENLGPASVLDAAHLRFGGNDLDVLLGNNMRE